jgi:hypothetical protein
VELFASYRSQTDRIMVLRCFRKDISNYRYELLEIPTAVFASVDQLSISQAQASTIPIPPDALPPHARIRIDRCDAKITVTGIGHELCAVHGRWSIPNLSGVAPEQG